MTTYSCPHCGMQFMDADEEFCPNDFTKLVATSVSDTPEKDDWNSIPTAIVDDSQQINWFAESKGVPTNANSADEDEKADTASTKSSSIQDALHKLVNSITGHNKTATSPDQESVAEQASLLTPNDVLPAQELEKGWKITGDLYSTKKYDLWPVTRILPLGSNDHGVFRKYKNGALTTRPVYEALTTYTGNATTQLYGYGTDQAGGGVRADYEITAAPKGQSLQSWLKNTLPSKDRARHLLALLVKLLQHLSEEGLRPITLTPNDLWISTGADYLTLAVLGAVTTKPDASPSQYCADLSSSALLTLPYAAPELIDRRILSINTETFAIGQLLSTAIFGEPQDHAFIRNGSVPFASVGDELLVDVLMGTLWPHPEQRWSVDDLSVALDSGLTDLSKRPPWKSLFSGAAGSAFTLAGVDFFLAEDLMAAAAKNWDEAAQRLDEMMTWLEKTRFAGQVEVLRRQMFDGRSTEWILIRLCRLITPDAPIIWRGLSLTDKEAERSLVALAQQALSLSEDGNATQAIATMELLFAADLRDAFTTPHNN
jgi:hypothetical protein